jgi:hypothetical protein
MFDPTAFENMKVVVEGAVYDRDFTGEITVTGRNDFVNLTDMSRQFMIEIEGRQSGKHKEIRGGILLEASLNNLAAELLAPNGNEAEAGCMITVFISFPNQIDTIKGQSLLHLLENIWGSERLIELTQSARIDNHAKLASHSTKLTISFGRLVKEEQMDDLLEMLDYLISSLKEIETVLKL